MPAGTRSKFSATAGPLSPRTARCRRSSSIRSGGKRRGTRSLRYRRLGCTAPPTPPPRWRNEESQTMIDELLPQAERIAARLRARGETISVAESSTAGLISAALLAIAGASAYFLGGAVVYTPQSPAALP